MPRKAKKIRLSFRSPVLNTFRAQYTAHVCVAVSKNR